jgi:hypothetical protein
MDSNLETERLEILEAKRAGEKQSMQGLQKVLRWFGLIVVCFAALFVYAKYSRHQRYPYGWSHCCITGLGMSLRNYAEKHDGNFPTGESCPEASLSLLHYQQSCGTGAEVLRGKTVPVEITQAVLDRGELLGPDSCGWHYVEGLREDDNPDIAILWDKVGLGHNGERGYHSVLCIAGFEKSIPDKEWPAFLEEQKALIEALPAERAKKADHATNTE